jgi:hypothetical protein
MASPAWQSGESEGPSCCCVTGAALLRVPVDLSVERAARVRTVGERNEGDTSQGRRLQATDNCRAAGPEIVATSVQASTKFVEWDTESIQDDDGEVAVFIEHRGEHVVVAG